MYVNRIDVTGGIILRIKMEESNNSDLQSEPESELDMHYSSSSFDGDNSFDTSESSDHEMEDAGTLDSQNSADVVEPYMYEPLASDSSDDSNESSDESEDLSRLLNTEW